MKSPLGADYKPGPATQSWPSSLSALSEGLLTTTVETGRRSAGTLSSIQVFGGLALRTLFGRGRRGCVGAARRLPNSNSVSWAYVLNNHQNLSVGGWVAGRVMQKYEDVRLA